MFKVEVNTRSAKVTQRERMTSGSVGLSCQFVFSADWNGLNKVVMFENSGNAEPVEVLLESSNTCSFDLPYDANTSMRVGIYGYNDTGTIIIPTIYAQLGRVEEGANPSVLRTGSTSQHIFAEFFEEVDAFKAKVNEIWAAYASNQFKGTTGAQGPKGDKGDKGDTGAEGPRGPKGEQGAQGNPGATGATGPKGDKGDDGLTGPKGDKGDAGPTGPQGPRGATGVQGPQGNQGPKGDVGQTGPQGIQGPKGDIGESGVAISETEPTNPDVTVWVNPNGSESDLDLLKNEVSTEITQMLPSKIKEVSVPKPTNSAVVGKVLKVQSVNADGSFVCTWADDESEQEIFEAIYGTTTVAEINEAIADNKQIFLRKGVCCCTTFSNNGGTFVWTEAGTGNNAAYTLNKTSGVWTTAYGFFLTTSSNIGNQVKNALGASAESGVIYDDDAKTNACNRIGATPIINPSMAYHTVVEFAEESTLEINLENLTRFNLYICATAGSTMGNYGQIQAYDSNNVDLGYITEFGGLSVKTATYVASMYYGVFPSKKVLQKRWGGTGNVDGITSGNGGDAEIAINATLPSAVSSIRPISKLLIPTLKGKFYVTILKY